MTLSVKMKKRLGNFRLDVQFEANQERFALLGASGCGKSVTLQCIAGLLTPDEGVIVLDGETLFDSAKGINLPPQRRRVGYLFQQYALFPNMTVRRNIEAAVADRKLRKEAAEKKIRQFQLEDVADKRPEQLSGGQQQRTALARILASEPKAILLDEPFSALDSYLKYQLELELAEQLENFDGPVLWVSHDRGEVFRNCRRVCVIDGGISQPVCTLDALFHAPQTEAAARLSGCKNYADAIPEGTAVFLPQWNIRLDCGRLVPEEIRRVGIRSHHAAIAAEAGENSFACHVTRVIEDVFSMIVLLRPETACADAPLLRMELDKAIWTALPEKERILVSVAAENILLLRD